MKSPQDIRLAERKARIRQKRLNERARRTFDMNGLVYHENTLQDWIDFKKEFQVLMDKHGITNHYFNFTLVRVNGKRLEKLDS